MSSKITVFKDFADTSSPKHVDVVSVLSAIKHPSNSLKELVVSIRSSKDEKVKKELKKKLPCILFSGTFSERNDASLIEHSGFAVFDFDHIQDLSILKNKLKLIPYVFSAFVSPSGDGIKCVVKVPASKENHRANHEHALADIKKNLDYLPSSCFDKTSINASRICFASHDEDIYINELATEFKPPRKKQIVATVDYSKINVAANMIRVAPDGQKHSVLLKAAKLIGGYVASGMIDESLALQILENEIANRDIDDIKGARKTIQDGLAYGKSMPLYETETLEGEASLEVRKTLLANPKRKYEFLTDPVEDEHDLDRYRNGGFKQGAPTGHNRFDEFFRFKEGDFNVVIGHANTGKSFFMWWLMVVSAVSLDWKWVVYSTENKVRQVKKKLAEFYVQEQIANMDEETYKRAKKWVEDMFTFIRIDRMYSAKQLLEFTEILIKEKEYKGFLIDPYNSLSIDKELWAELKGNRHEYDYAVASEFVNFSDKHNISIYLNAHAMTEALRRKHTSGMFQGHPMPPESADIEGGGKFVNRTTGFFLVIHRYIYHETERFITKVEVKKVKDSETGGIQTKYEDPVNFELKGYLTYFCEQGTNYNPILYKKPEEVQSALELKTTSLDQAFGKDIPF